MDAIINGAGTITKGEYEIITVNGSAHISGDVKCSDFTVNGACNSSGRIECDNEMRISGSASFSKEVSSGSLHCMGSAVFNSSVLSRNIRVDGSARFDKDIKCDSFKSSGAFGCGGIINAKNVEIIFSDRSKIKEICSSTVNIECTAKPKSFFKKLFSSKKDGRLIISESIGGDDVSVSGVIAPIVSGKNVIIGEGCIIDRVIYSESVEVSPKAKVKESKKT